MTLTYQGKSCKLGHTERYASNGRCVECNKVSQAAYKLRNPEDPAVRRARNIDWRRRNPDKVKAIAARWVKANPEKHNAWGRAWSKRNPAKGNEKAARRRALVRSAQCDCCDPGIFQFLYVAARELGLEVDHRLPLAMGGKHCAKNLQVLTPEMHKQKTRTDNAAIAAFKRDWLNAETSPEWEAPVLSPEYVASFNDLFDSIEEQLEESN